MPTVDQFLDAPVKQSADDFLDADTAPLSDQTLQRLQQSAQIDSANKLYRQAQEESKLATIPIMTAIPGAIGALSTPLFHPKTSPEDLAFRERHPIIGGIEKGIVSLAEGFTSPIGVATLGIGALPAQAQRAVAAGFAAQMASQVPEVAGQLGEEFGKPTDQRDTQKIAALITEGVGTLGMVAAAGKKGIAEPIAERAGAIPTFQVPRPLATIQPAGETYAPEARQIQESRQPEYQRVEAQRLPPEAGGGNRPVGSPPSEVLPQPKPQAVAPAELLPPEEQAAVQAELARTQEEMPSGQLFVRPKGADTLYPVASLEEAQAKYNTMRKASNVGARELPSAEVLDNSGKQVARISYNGRVWDMEGKELLTTTPAATTAEILGEKPTPAPTPPPEPAAETPVAKEPWKMTQSEFVDNPKRIHGSEVLPTMDWLSERLGGKKSIQEAFGRIDTVEGDHVLQVANALRQGKPVPREVLADYPDLAKQAATETETGKSVPPEQMTKEQFKIWQKKNAIRPLGNVVFKTAASAKKVVERNPQSDLVDVLPRKQMGGTVYEIVANQDYYRLSSQTPSGVSIPERGAFQAPVSEPGGASVTTDVPNVARPASGDSPLQVLSTAASVQINAPEGATYLQITQKGGGVAREPISKLQKSNTFRGVDIASVKAGHIGKGGKFIEDTGPLTVREPISVGPGAETAGEAKYTAIQQLVDQLKTVPDTGLPEKITARERIADAWAKGKSAVRERIAGSLENAKSSIDAAIARMQAVSQSLKDTARGVRDVTDLDRRVGSLDWALQRSAAMSKRAKLSIRDQIKDQATRDAVAIWNDTPGTDAKKIAAIQDTIANLPANTPNRIRRALQKATNLDAKAREFSESLRQYYGIRLNDAQEAAIFEHGLQDYYTHIWKKESNMPDDLRAALSNGRVSTYFEFARKRKFGTFLDGIRAGKVPELDPADIIPIYNYSLDRAIASRQLIRDVSEMVEPDGRPTLTPAGKSIPVEKGGTPDRLIIKPKARSEENADYQIINHPALRKWKWAGTDENGNPILYQSDLLVHKDSYQRLSRMMDRSRLSPSPMVRALLSASTEVKGFKLGLLSAFHAIHTGSHALFHWTNPFRAGRIPIDWESPNTRFAVEKGHLKLAPDPGELKIVSEGIVPGRLVEKIPILGPWSRVWSEFQFGELIPRWKLATFENAYKRNLWARDNLPGSGLKGLTDEQIAARVGDSVNNAFGELNKLFLGKFGRSPEMQRMLRGIFLAPDFGEARLRFVEKALTKSGFEERLAIATMFLTLYTGARVANYLSHGDPEMDWKKAFGVKFGDHWWSMRSVVGDLDHLFADFGRFMYVRLNPVYARTASDMLFGRDVSGRKLTSWQKFVSRPLDQLIPIQFGALTRDDQKIWESFVTAMGVQTQRDSPTRDLRQIIGNWKKASTNPKIRADWERSQQELFAPSPYEPLRNALRLDNPERAVAEYRKLREIRKPDEIDRAMQNKRPFTGSLQAERQFTAQMTPEQAVVYRDAVRERDELYRKYQAILHNEVQTSPRPVTAQDFQPSPMGE